MNETTSDTNNTIGTTPWVTSARFSWPGCPYCMPACLHCGRPCGFPYPQYPMYPHWPTQPGYPYWFTYTCS